VPERSGIGGKKIFRHFGLPIRLGRIQTTGLHSRAGCSATFGHRCIPMTNVEKRLCRRFYGVPSCLDGRSQRMYDVTMALGVERYTTGIRPSFFPVF